MSRELQEFSVNGTRIRVSYICPGGEATSPHSTSAAAAAELSLEAAGQKLRRVREHLQLRYRDVAQASEEIAVRRGNHQFAIRLSRLADIENKQIVPSIYRVYSLCAIYRLDFVTVLRWYHIDLTQLVEDAFAVGLSQTHPVTFDYGPDALIDYAKDISISFPTTLAENVDFQHTGYLTRQIRQWGKLPLAALAGFDLQKRKYGFVGTSDWSMYPVLVPGTFFEIDESRRRLEPDTWTNDYDRPIHFVEHRKGYRCAWCTRTGDYLVLQYHPSSHLSPEIFRNQEEAEILGQVVAVAMRLRPGPRPRTRS